MVMYNMEGPWILHCPCSTWQCSSLHVLLCCTEGMAIEQTKRKLLFFISLENDVCPIHDGSFSVKAQPDLMCLSVHVQLGSLFDLQDITVLAVFSIPC